LHVSEAYRLQKLANIQDKHLASYAKALKEAGRSDKYIKTELSAVRFLHNSIPLTKHELMDGTVFNKSLKLGKTSDYRIDRAWEQREFIGFIQLFHGKGKSDIADVLECIRYSGMRLDEVCSLKGKDVVRGLDKGILHLKNTKGGVPRDIIITEQLKEILTQKLDDEKKSEILFTPTEYVNRSEIHKYEKKIQNEIYRNRLEIQDKDRANIGHNVTSDQRGALTIHGLRHCYAREQYNAFVERGMSEYTARKKTAELLGHGRDSVTRIYLAGKY